MPDRIKIEASFDILSDIFETLRFSGSIFFRSDLAAPWGVSLTRINSPRFHIILSGDCFVGTQGQDALKASEMDIIMLPTGSSHWIADKPGRELISSESAGNACELGEPLFQQGTITNRLICGLVNFEQNVTHPILDSLPELIDFSMIDPAGPIWALVMLIDEEMSSKDRIGSHITDRLTEVLFLKLLHQYVSENKETPGFFAALGDKRIHRALTLIHADPGQEWSLSILGEAVGMSRATLVRHFKGSVGVAPMAYISNWRMIKAYSLIKHTSSSLEQVALSLGFKSARSLTRAFVRQYGVTPSKLTKG